MVGTLVYDLIQPLIGDTVQGYGGIYHTLVSLSSLCQSDDEIIPVTYVGEDHWQRVRQFIDNEKNISPGGLVPIKAKTNCSILKYYSQSERTEVSIEPYPPLRFAHIESFLDCDMMLINMISGWDIDLNTLQEVRRNYQGEIYIDIHNYLTELDHESKRCYRIPNDIAAWLQQADIIQLNEKEFNVLNQEQSEIGDFCRKYCISEKKLINLTLGSIGSRSILVQNSQLKSYLNKISTNKNTRDTTGCGDAFSAGFIYGYLLKKDIDTCLNLANCVASLYSEFSGPAEINRFRLKLKQKCQGLKKS